MKKISQILKGLRPEVSIPAGILVHVGYNLQHQKTEWGLALLVFFLTGLIMLQNDYFDRVHDLQKGKRFAYDNERFLLVFLTLAWTGVLGIAAYVYPSKVSLLLLGATIAFSYSYFRKFTGLSHVIVAVLSATPLILARVNHSESLILWLGSAVICVIFGRELLKDIEDRIIDQGYKRTLLTAQILTYKSAHYVSAIAIAIGAIISFVVIPNIHGFPFSFYLAGICLLINSVLTLWYLQETRGGKRSFDFGMMLILVSFSI